ncbi:putative alpha-1,2-mannosidase [Sphingomonas naasensis]|uniref:Glycoside hydrolase family 92 protein n=1 Tax=Sphingomonas naasensis TaxID=1344951 RepID=A0A4V3QWZ7_9SPHN|nr:GH92 family glycosyl hydrolase [Sphingomonas naasensis]NIJ20350.1 putative alpha-1,2-mannosidase [Sphingomonas naasensis]TGX44462.1 glycoside hydrolase family 92 protein [Sphingomonas naasensis]
MNVTRRQLLASSAVGLTLAAAPAGARGRAGAAPNLFIGTGGHGHTYPGPTLPFGMVQLGPDTDVERWDACSGYHRTDTSIMGFSHTHLSGTGIGDMLDVLVVPTRGPVQLLPGPREDPDQGYRQRFSGEHAEPGYYRVALESGVQAELSVTDRVGWHRYRFPKGRGHVLVDLSHLVADSPRGRPLIDEAALELDADGTLTGGRRVFRWAKGRRVFFAMQFSRAPDRVTFYGDGDAEQPAGTRRVAGKRLKAVFHYDDAGAAPILIRCAISAVDVAGARANLAAEARHWDFDKVRRSAQARWAGSLGAIRVEGGSPDQRTIFATALYHAQVAPTLLSDVDGRYPGLDGKVQRAPAGEAAFSSYSLWDTYRALHPLLTLVAPERAKALVDDLIRQTAQSPYGPLVWPLQGRETGTMIGWHGVVPIAEAHAKGIPADYAAAWPAIAKRSFDFGAPDLANSRGRDFYDRLGYVPADKVNESVSRTQEYAYDDWASAWLARAAGADADADRLLKRSGNWRNVIDADIGFARPRFADGSWWKDYDPIQLGHMPEPDWRDYTEANGWQASFLNQHDIYGLIAHLGGDAKFEAQLDALFSAPSTLPANAPPDIAGLVGQYAHGNEPDQHAPWLYAYAGAPWKTQAMVRRLCAEMYRNDPDGIIGNDDCGQMSAWFVFAALGFYPVDPVEAAYVFGSPLFERAEVSVGRGRSLVIEAPGNGPDTPYVVAVTWNGRPWTKSWIGHSELTKGGTLRFTMARTPNRAFGHAPADRPPSFGRTPA